MEINKNPFPEIKIINVYKPFKALGRALIDLAVNRHSLNETHNTDALLLSESDLPMQTSFEWSNDG